MPSKSRVCDLIPATLCILLATTGIPAQADTGKSNPPGHPKGFEGALKLYNSGKYALAAVQFQKFIKDGVADEETHMYLAYCFYYQRMYSKALKEFDWLSKNAKQSISTRRNAESYARVLRSNMSGICPGNCLKANDPRWQHMHVDGHPDTDVWIKFTYDGGDHSWSQHHIGEVIEYVNGQPVNKGQCPICHGTTRVRALKDGDPLSR